MTIQGKNKRELHSQDETKPDSNNIFDSGEIVFSEKTNASLNSTVFKELILFYQPNNMLNKLREEHPIIVRKLETILKTKRGGEIATKIYESQVFAIPTLIHHFRHKHHLTYKMAKPYIYEITKTLEIEKVIEWTPYEAIHPNSKRTGPRAHVYKLVGIELNGREDPLLMKAQKEYEAAPLNYDEQAKKEYSVKNSFSRISRLIADQFIEKGDTFINPEKVIQICRDSFRDEILPADRREVAREGLYRGGAD